MTTNRWRGWLAVGMWSAGAWAAESSLPAPTLSAGAMAGPSTSLATPPAPEFSLSVGHLFQLGGFGLALGSQTVWEASSSREGLLVGGVATFVMGTLAQLLAFPVEGPALAPAVTAPPTAPPVTISYAASSALQSLKQVKGLSIREGVEIQRIVVLLAATLLKYQDADASAPAVKAERILALLADAYRESGRSGLTLVVHANPTGDPEADRLLAEARRKALLSFFVDREALPADQVTGVAAGASQPLVPATHPDAAKINPRVEALFQAAASAERPALALQQLEQAPGVQVRRTVEAVESAILASEDAVLFDIGSAKPNKASEAVLEKIGAAVREAIASPGHTRVLIAGHTDAAGSAEYNHRLSLERAQAVAAAIISRQQLSDGVFECVGYGFTQALADNATPEGRTKNRRVEITIKKSLGR